MVPKKAFILGKDDTKPQALDFDFNRVIGSHALTQDPAEGERKAFNLGNGHRLIIAKCSGTIRADLEYADLAITEARQKLKEFLLNRGFGMVIVNQKLL